MKTFRLSRRGAARVGGHGGERSKGPFRCPRGELSRGFCEGHDRPLDALQSGGHRAGPGLRESVEFE